MLMFGYLVVATTVGLASRSGLPASAGSGIVNFTLMTGCLVHAKCTLDLCHEGDMRTLAAHV